MLLMTGGCASATDSRKISEWRVCPLSFMPARCSVRVAVGRGPWVVQSCTRRCETVTAAAPVVIR